MPDNAIDRFVNTAHAAWDEGEPATVEACVKALAELTRADESEPWLAALLAEKPASRELHRHPEDGFMLLAHTENQGLYRPPHDHGRAWVVYAVQSGELEVGTYKRVPGPDGVDQLAEIGREVIRAGESRAYRTGEIHDTRCLTETALLFRFTERDLRHEDQVERKVTRFVMRDGHWSAPLP